MKQNAYIDRLHRQWKAESEIKSRFILQQTLDAAMIAANEVFQLGPKRAPLFAEAMQRVYTEIATMTLDDAKDDNTIAYTKEMVDRRLKEICGDGFVPWEQRYGGI